MLKIGCHLSVSDGYEKMLERAIKINANTFQFFTRNPRGGQARDLDLEELERMGRRMEENNFAKILAHGAYTINLASKSEDTREFGKMILKDDIKRLNKIPNSHLVFHPGSHVGQGSEKGIELIIQGLNEVIEKDNKVDILLETMPGVGTEVGRSFEELRDIIDGVENNERLGVCIDTCHMYSAGYDIVNDLDGVLEEFERVVGLDRIKAVHLNDSKTELASNKDRHELIGEGTIGKKALVNIINHPKLRDLPFYLETPNELEGYKKEIKMLREEYK